MQILSLNESVSEGKKPSADSKQIEEVKKKFEGLQKDLHDVEGFIHNQMKFISLDISDNFVMIKKAIKENAAEVINILGGKY